MADSSVPSPVQSKASISKLSASPMWPLDTAFALLGILVIGLVLRLLRMDDPRWAYNAWTYLVGVPTILIFASMLMRTLVSEQVERSIQIGFLISVVAHLLLMVVAVNVVLFSGIWPDAVREMERIVRDNSRATQFVEMSPTQEAVRPDYLAPVVTELTQPTKTEWKPSPTVDAPLESVRESIDPSVPNPRELTPSESAKDVPEPQILSEARSIDRPQRDLPKDSQRESIAIPKVDSQSSSDPESSAYAALTERATEQAVSRDQRTSMSQVHPATSGTWVPEAALNKEMRRSEDPISRLPLPVRPDGQLPNLERFSQSRTLNAPSERTSLPQPSRARPIEVPAAGASGALPSGEAASGTSTAGRQSQTDPAEVLDRTQGTSRSRSEGGASTDPEAARVPDGAIKEPAIGSLAEGRVAGGRIGSSAASMSVGDLQVGEPSLPSLDVSRFRKREIGGAIPKTQVSIPAPAFKQRMRRNDAAMNQDLQAMGPLGPQTEDAIERGLEFLARHQREDGSWRLEDFGDEPRLRSDTAATALALLSFQGAGYSHVQFKYQQTCKRALDWLQAQQRPDGDLYRPMDEASDRNAWLYSHAIASLAVCEAYGMTQDDAIRALAQKSVDFLVESQDPAAGGWRYAPRVGSDTSVTGWAMMALKSAELAGLQVPSKAYEGINRWLNGAEASSRERYRFRYNWQANTPETMHGRVPTPVMTSVGLLMRLYLGWRRTTPEMQLGTDWLLEQPPSLGTEESPQRDTYYWYYASQVMFHMGGQRWRQWYSTLYPILIQSQATDGPYAGSWDPAGPIPDAWGPYAGRLYVTTMNLLSLEVTYRHLPIYEATAQ